jgi:hypothetical protein
MLLMLLGLLSMGMALIGLSLTPLVLGGVLLGLGILIFQVQRLQNSLREFVSLLRLRQHEKLDSSA